MFTDGLQVEKHEQKKPHDQHGHADRAHGEKVHEAVGAKPAERFGDISRRGRTLSRFPSTARWPLPSVLSFTGGRRDSDRCTCWLPSSVTLPRSIVMIRRCIFLTVSQSCVATSTVVPFMLMSLNRRNTSWPLCGSRLPVGSSASSTWGSFTSARATATRCCSPPESLGGVRCCFVFHADFLEHLVRAPLDLAVGRADHLEGKRDVLEHGLVGKEFVVLEHEPHVAPEIGDARRVEPEGVHALDDDLPLVRVFGAEEDLEQRASCRRRSGR